MPSSHTLFETLWEVRNTVVNLVGLYYISGEERNFNNLLKDVAQELGEVYDFGTELFDMQIDDLLDLGFEFEEEDAIDGDLLLVPVWLYPFIPEGTTLIDTNRDIFVVGDDKPTLCRMNWVNVGFIP